MTTGSKDGRVKLTPLEIARLMHAREGAGPAWGVRTEDVGEGYARIAMTVTAAMTNGYGTIHGGMIFALADTAFAYFCNGRNEKTVAAQAGIVFLGSAGEGEILVAEGEEAATAGRGGVTRVSVRTADGRPIAEFTGYSRMIGGAVVEV